MAFQLWSVRGLAATALAVAFAIAPALAGNGSWQLSSVRGLVVYLQDGKWQELDPNQPLGTTTLRTLRSGRVRVEGKNVKIDMGPNAALKFTSSSDGSSATIDQYEGSINLSIPPGGGPPPLVVRAGKITLSHIAGSIDVSVVDNAVSVLVKSGSVSATSAGARVVQLLAGDYETDSTGVLLAAESPTQSVAAGTDGTDSADTTTPPVGPGNNNGNGNGPSGSNNGGNGNGTSGNSAGGNNNGSGNGGSNGGGNGNGGSNGGGNGNGKGNGQKN